MAAEDMPTSMPANSSTDVTVCLIRKVDLATEDDIRWVHPRLVLGGMNVDDPVPHGFFGIRDVVSVERGGNRPELA